MNNEIRKQIRFQRKDLNPLFRSQATEKISQTVLSLTEFNHSQNIGCYLAYHGEVETFAIIKQIWQLQKKCYLPILREDDNAHMDFAPYHPHNKLIKNRYGINEPHHNKDGTIGGHKLDLVIMPLVAFDKKGTRLGMGAGYYDRSFQDLLNKKRPTQPFLLGLAYHFQQVDMLERKPWDVPLDAVITEEKTIFFHDES